MIELKRSDRQYVDIENFKLYELTHNICYEMAIRNNEVQTLIKKYIGQYYSSIVEYNIERQKIYNKLMKYFINPISGLYLKYHFFSYKYKEDEHYPNQSKEYIQKKLEFKNEKIIYFNKETKDYSLHSSISEKTINDGSITNYNHIITPLYSRPTLLFVEEDVIMNIKLNLAMPKEELVNFIERLKDDYDKDHKTIMSLSELLGKELTPFRDIIFHGKNNPIIDRKTKKEMKATSFTSNGFKMADIFFIYDCLVLKYSEQKIKYLLVEYYETIKNKKNTIDDERYRRYVSIGKDFIDNKRYKELFLGSHI